VTEDDRLIGEDDLDAYVDGRLSESRAGEVARYLACNPSVQARVAQDIAARDALRHRLAFIVEQPIPPRLRTGAIRARLRAVRMQRLYRAAACVGILVLGAASGWEARELLAGSPGQRSIAAAINDAISAHRVFAVETVHPVEVAAAQQLHLMQWLSKRVGHELETPDLSTQGYTLMGGRLLPTRNASAAQFMYENGVGQRVTLYVRESTSEDRKFRESTSEDSEFSFAQNGGINAYSWVEEGLGFALVGTIGRDALLGLAEVACHQLDPTWPPATAPL
jgi:anti-sigma factor RsiW